MLPARFTVVPSFPLTPSGKVDRARLSDAGAESLTVARSGVRPSNANEELLCGIIAEVLGLDEIGIHDNFFALGGDSLLAIQVVARANRAGLHIRLQHLLDPASQTVASLAALHATTASAAPEAAPPDGPVPLTPIQQWFFQMDSPEPHHYNQALLFDVRVEVDGDRAAAAARSLIERHDALSLRFERTGDAWAQSWHGPSMGDCFAEVDLSFFDTEQARAILEEHCAAEQSKLDLVSGRLLRVILYRLPDASTRVLFVAHHLAVDGVSWQILLEDFFGVCTPRSRHSLHRRVLSGRGRDESPLMPTPRKRMPTPTTGCESQTMVRFRFRLAREPDAPSPDDRREYHDDQYPDPFRDGDIAPQSLPETSVHRGGIAPGSSGPGAVEDHGTAVLLGRPRISWPRRAVQRCRCNAHGRLVHFAGPRGDHASHPARPPICHRRRPSSTARAPESGNRFRRASVPGRRRGSQEPSGLAGHARDWLQLSRQLRCRAPFGGHSSGAGVGGRVIQPSHTASSFAGRERNHRRRRAAHRLGLCTGARAGGRANGRDIPRHAEASRCRLRRNIGQHALGAGRLRPSRDGAVARPRASPLRWFAKAKSSAATAMATATSARSMRCRRQRSSASDP